jgi:hypothetical protein
MYFPLYVFFFYLADGLIGVGIATTAVGLLVGGIAAALMRKK